MGRRRRPTADSRSPTTRSREPPVPPLDGGDLGRSQGLVVDDDFRNIFAITALLERGHARVVSAESGADAIATLEEMPDIDIVLMDIMMPGMDGYATMQAIRRLRSIAQELPIIAVTGKVVPGERKRCIDAGANDYVPKPVDTAELLALMRWLATPAEPGRSKPANGGAGQRRRLDRGAACCPC